MNIKTKLQEIEVLYFCSLKKTYKLMFGNDKAK